MHLCSSENNDCTVDDKMKYLALMWGFNQVARVSEYNSVESLSEYHSVQEWQVSFVIGGGTAASVSDDPYHKVIACEVEASSHKGGGELSK